MRLIRQMPGAAASFIEDETGASPTEYLLVASLVAVIAGLTVLAMHR